MFNSTREFEACVLVNGKPVTEVVFEGRSYIEGRKKSTYELYFKNNTFQPVLVVPSVDGMSVIDGETAGKTSPGYVLDPWSEVTVPGWTVNGREAAEFIFHAQNAYRSDERTYAEESGKSQQNQGVIGFLVFRQQYIPRPIVTRSFVAGHSSPVRGMSSHSLGSTLDSHTYGTSVGSVSVTSSSVSDNLGNTPKSVWQAPDMDEGKPLGTGFGQAVGFETQKIEFQRETEPCAVFALYYDTVKNLKRIGVPVEQFQRHYSDTYDSGPNPFPDSPEVTGYAKPPKGWTGGRYKKSRR